MGIHARGPPFWLMACEAFSIVAATSPIHTLAHLRDLVMPMRRNACLPETHALR